MIVFNAIRFLCIFAFMRKHSLASRLSFWVILTTALVLSVVSLFVNFMVTLGIISESEQKAYSMLDNAGDHIDKELIAVESAVLNTMPLIQQNLNHPERFDSFLSRLVEVNPTIAGSTIAMEPDFYKGKHFFSPYVYSEADSLIHTTLNGEEYDYFSQEWYAVPKLQKAPHWSEPYLDTGGGGFAMTTYSSPILDKEGRFCGVLTADVSLNWLAGVLDDFDELTPSAFDFLLSKSGKFLIHPDSTMVLNASIYSMADREQNEHIAELGRKMTAGETGSRQFSGRDKQVMRLFYAPISKTGWSMAIICPQEEFFLTSRVVSRIVTALMIIGLIIIILVCHVVLRRLTKPLRVFTASADAIAGGDLHAPLPEIRSNDELMTLKNSFATMQTSLEERMKQLKEVNEAQGRIEGELQSARAIQQSMLPSTFPPFEGCPEVAAYGQLTPAKEVGGDLFDIFIRKRKLYFCIGDVSGKGVPASLLMAVTRSLFRNLSGRVDNASQIVYSINNALAENNSQNMFATFFMGILDLDTGHLCYCNGGHNAPLLLRDQAAFIDVIPNLPLGVMERFEFQTQEMDLAPGDTVFLYTDGLTEAENADKKLFGEERTLETAQRMCHQPVRRQIELMDGAVAVFVDSAQQSDDLTMMSVQYKGVPAPLNDN